ncbi:uncharacterized protein [Venturia canescens]|uniref:uncharacterized protein n=1 Tax=Venturia canescens TaxID=32260 RepID=UPI001C9C35E1|nr:uncharacterized protein LOC122416586 [Venturia canescens]
MQHEDHLGKLELASRLVQLHHRRLSNSGLPFVGAICPAADKTYHQSGVNVVGSLDGQGPEPNTVGEQIKGLPNLQETRDPYNAIVILNDRVKRDKAMTMEERRKKQEQNDRRTTIGLAARQADANHDRAVQQAHQFVNQVMNFQRQGMNLRNATERVIMQNPEATVNIMRHGNNARRH